MGRMFALFLFAAAFSYVEGHGGMVIPLTWVDVGKIGDDIKGIGTIGCYGIGRVDPKDGMLWNGMPMDSIQNHRDKMNYTDMAKNHYTDAKIFNRMSGPNCYFLVRP